MKLKQLIKTLDYGTKCHIEYYGEHIVVVSENFESNLIGMLPFYPDAKVLSMHIRDNVLYINAQW